MRQFLSSGSSLVLFAALGLSFKSIVARLAYGYGVEPSALLIMRLLFAAPLFVATLLIVRGLQGFRISPKLFAILVVAGAGLGGAMLASFHSIKVIGAGLATLVVFTYPAITVLLERVVDRKPIGRSKALSLIVTLSGLALVVRVDDVEFVAVNQGGFLLALTSAVLFACFNLINERIFKEISPLQANTFSISVAFICLLIAVPPQEYPSSVEVWGAAIFLGLFSGYIPFLLFTYGIKKLGASRAGITNSISPVLATIWAYWILGETLVEKQVVGMALVILGIILLRPTPEKKAEVETGQAFGELNKPLTQASQSQPSN